VIRADADLPATAHRQLFFGGGSGGGGVQLLFEGGGAPASIAKFSRSLFEILR
jgi:hypothetical protein